MIDIKNIRNKFPLLNQRINDRPLVYLDNAATTQKPVSVLKSIEKYYTEINANVHRGIHTLSREATLEMENSRKKIKEFISASSENEIIFTKGTTEGINLLASSIEPIIRKGDIILLTQTEHHSNIVPWQMLCERTGAEIKVIPVDQNGELLMEEYLKLLSNKVRIVAINHISNSLGIINPIDKIIEAAHHVDAYVLVDGAQAIAHQKVDVLKLDVDFYVFSAHKMYGPTGVGILYGKEALLEQMRPYQGGGEMIKQVTFDKTTYACLPFKFEAGTPNIAGNIALHSAINFIEEIGLELIREHENAIFDYASEELSKIENITIYSLHAKRRTGLISFNSKLENIHSSDVGFILDKLGVAVRTGHHCAQPTMDFLKIGGTIRASFAIYNTFQDIDILVDAVKQAQKMLS